MTHDRATTRTNTARLVAEAARADEMLGLNRSAEALVPKTEKGRRALALLAAQEKQLLSLRRRLMEAALVELLWQYQDFVEGSDTGYIVRQLMADIGARE
jgi:cellobiose phosphorylase